MFTSGTSAKSTNQPEYPAFEMIFTVPTINATTMAK
jgi:hypothetical protein